MNELENMTKEQLVQEVKYLNALLQTLLNKNAQLNLEIANFETRERLNNDSKTSNE
ncbi:hypothetical protein [Staphylococcus coagulans]|uniref:hypothetical protein n=1 Tax=Staphylococcus coagulans TaxID=74706 RepID=UPI000A6442D8|nr:hypothetical protein [Staphylococcus coagulans]MBT2818479.1 hypothetical protein [Staphylococcus coagulans]